MRVAIGVLLVASFAAAGMLFRGVDKVQTGALPTLMTLQEVNSLTYELLSEVRELVVEPSEDSLRQIQGVKTKLGVLGGVVTAAADASARCVRVADEVVAARTTLAAVEADHERIRRRIEAALASVQQRVLEAEGFSPALGQALFELVDQVHDRRSPSSEEKDDDDDDDADESAGEAWTPAKWADLERLAADDVVLRSRIVALQGTCSQTAPVAEARRELESKLEELEEAEGGHRRAQADALHAAETEAQGALTDTSRWVLACMIIVLLTACFSLVAASLTASQQERLMVELAGTSNELEAFSRQILTSSRQLEESGATQASGVEETRRTMDSLLEGARRITEATRSVHENAQETKAASESTASRAAQLRQHTSRIADVLASIQKIADKSDMLALNAALEGTKAGEAGRGFIFVAEEMRRLAESVMGAVADIQKLVEAMREASQASVLASEESVKRSHDTAESAEMIRLTVQQQQTGTEQVTASMNDISLSIAHGLAAARQGTQAVTDLGGRTSRLRDLLAGYQEGRTRSARS